MVIAVLNYVTSSVDIFETDEVEYAENAEQTQFDVESYLESLGYGLDDIYFMCDPDNININLKLKKDEDSNQD